MDSGMVYFLGFISVAIYYVKKADSFGSGVVGILKAIVWPAVVVYKVFKYMNW